MIPKDWFDEMWDDARVGFLRTDWEKGRAVIVECVRMGDELFDELQKLVQAKGPPDDPAWRQRLREKVARYEAQTEKVQRVMGKERP